MRHIRRYEIHLLAGLLLTAFSIAAYLQPAKSQVTALSPLGTSVPLSTTSAQVIGLNPTRRSLTFCNPSTIIIWIAPSGITPLAAGGVGIGLPAASTGTTVCFSTTVIGDRTQGQAWNAIAASGTPNLTILEYP
jgi:hypothetical protein